MDFLSHNLVTDDLVANNRKLQKTKEGHFRFSEENISSDVGNVSYPRLAQLYESSKFARPADYLC